LGFGLKRLDVKGRGSSPAASLSREPEKKASIRRLLRMADDVEVGLLDLRLLHDAPRSSKRCLAGFVASFLLRVGDRLATRDPIAVAKQRSIS
jgi:hypothetical protein